MLREYREIADAIWCGEGLNIDGGPGIRLLGITESQLAEERLRRFTQVSMHMATAYPVFHRLLTAWGGEQSLWQLVECLWTEMRDRTRETPVITDTFYPSLIAAAVDRLGNRSGSSEWFGFARTMFLLELGRDRAQRVSISLPDPVPPASLTPGSSLLLTNFDLVGVYKHCERLQKAHVPESLIRTDVAPVGQESLTVIFVSSSDVLELRFKLNGFPEGDPRELLRRFAPAVAREIIIEGSYLSARGRRKKRGQRKEILK